MFVSFSRIYVKKFIRGREDYVIFRLFKSILLDLNCSSPFKSIVLIKYYHILFIIIVFRLGSDKLSPVSSTVFPKGSVTGCDSSLRGGWMIFHFRLFKSILFFCKLKFIIHFPSLI